VVPNVVHFIWSAHNSSKELTFINYISIVSAYRIQKPDAILLHCNYLPTGQWWQQLWKEVSINTVTDEAAIHLSRFVRLKLLRGRR